MKSVTNIISCVFVLLIASSVDCARILCIFPYPSHSHHVVYHTFTRELSKRGHEITIFTTDPLNDPNLKNYTEIDMHHMYKEINKRFNFVETLKNGMWVTLAQFYDFMAVVSDNVLSNPVMKELVANKTKFDVMIVHFGGLEAISVLSYKFDAPMIGITTTPFLSTHGYLIGNPLHSSYSPNLYLPYDENMNFWQRLHNLYVNLRQIFEYHTIIMQKQEKILRKHFGDDTPDINNFNKRFSLLFAYSHPYLHYPRPFIPSIIQIGGLRYSYLNKTLPQDIKTLLDNAKSGFIYFSLGTNLRSNRLPRETLNILLSAFAELPYQILWKFESDTITGKPDNVHIAKWLPQHGILAHPNIKLFMYQGGLQSTEEAIECAVPLLAFPLFSDQMCNVKVLTKKGVAKGMNIYEIDKDSIKNTIMEIVTNTSYKKSMESLHNLFQDRPRHPLNETIWWIEHVIRNKGADHLQTYSRNMSWITLHNIDVFAFLGVILIAIISTIAITFHCIIRKLNLSRIKYLSRETSRTRKSKSS